MHHYLSESEKIHVTISGEFECAREYSCHGSRREIRMYNIYIRIYRDNVVSRQTVRKITIEFWKREIFKIGTHGCASNFSFSKKTNYRTVQSSVNKTACVVFFFREIAVCLGIYDTAFNARRRSRYSRFISVMRSR